MNFASRLASALIVATVLVTGASAQSYPNRPIKIVVPFAAGSGGDAVTRMIAEELHGELNVAVVVENRPGASGMIGSEAVARSAPDGYTLMSASTSTHSSLPSLFKKIPFDVEKDFQPIANIVESVFLLVVRNDMPVRNLAELKAWLSTNKSTASYGYGTPTTQIAGASFLKRANLSATPVPYKSNPPALTDLIGGVTSFMFLDQTTALPQIAAGKIRAIVVASNRRMSELPDVPTTIESGMPDFTITTWVGLLAPAGLPADVSTKLTAAMNKIMVKNSVQEKLARAGRAVPPTSTAEFLNYLKVERAAWTRKVQEAGIQPE
jgi:tripartite-type tricarboxylate transporter receptor subunit TctC